MAINVKCIQRANPQNRSNVKWYPVQNTEERLEEDEVAEQIADETTLNPSEALMAIRQLRKVVTSALLSGNSVKLGNWGSFSVALKTTGADSKEELSAKNIEQVNIRFTPGSEVKAEMQKAKFTWINKDSDDEEADEEEESSESEE